MGFESQPLTVSATHFGVYPMVLGLVFFLSMAALILIRQLPVIGEYAPLLVELAPVFAVMLTVGSMIVWRCKEPME